MPPQRYACTARQTQIIMFDAGGRIESAIGPKLAAVLVRATLRFSAGRRCPRLLHWFCLRAGEFYGTVWLTI
ncbi:hypothetical protein KCP76_20745 [Salmonella enterica subsp. enterica serovar Weltevreden]|nr:hypothetical protein KCP76_20745 [Salmonella enterica subsp. enterica serovar Weltevreden]